MMLINAECLLKPVEINQLKHTVHRLPALTAHRADGSETICRPTDGSLSGHTVQMLQVRCPHRPVDAATQKMLLNRRQRQRQLRCHLATSSGRGKLKHRLQPEKINRWLHPLFIHCQTVDVGTLPRAKSTNLRNTQHTRISITKRADRDTHAVQFLVVQLREHGAFDLVWFHCDPVQHWKPMFRLWRLLLLYRHCSSCHAYSCVITHHVYSQTMFIHAVIVHCVSKKTTMM